MSKAEKLLKVLLVCAGLACCTAIVPMLMPRGWIAKVHRDWLGMGEFPDQPVAEYLARATSGMYALYGGLLLLLAGRVKRYARLIRYQAVAIAALAVVGAFYGGMPWYWVVGDVATAGGFCALTLVLQARMSR